MNAFCPNCGKPTQPNDVFCRNCGHRLADEATAEPTDRLSQQAPPTEQLGVGPAPPTAPVPPLGAPQPYLPVPSPSRTPPWLPIAIIAAVVIIGGLLALLLFGGDDEPAPTAVEFPEAPAAPPTAADQAPDSRVLGQWICEGGDSWEVTIQQGTWSLTDSEGGQGSGTWSYDQGTNSYTFSGSYPEYGADSLQGSVTVSGDQFTGSLQRDDSDPDLVEGSSAPGDVGTIREPADEDITCRRA
jgi:hypothetical protein